MNTTNFYIMRFCKKAYDKLCIISFFLMIFPFVNGQEFHSKFNLSNNHLWRGMEVTSGLVYTGHLQLEGENFYGGFWVGGNTSGSYKEFDHYIGYKTKNDRIKIELWDIYNFSPDATYNNKEYFNYSAATTGRFWDFRTYYTISEKFPLQVSWNFVMFGRDRNIENSGNKYSYFASLEYPLIRKDDLEVKGRVGYADAINSYNEKANFFSSNNGINEVSLIISKKYAIGNFSIPLGFWAMWNPVDNKAYIQLSLQLFSF